MELSRDFLFSALPTAELCCHMRSNESMLENQQYVGLAIDTRMIQQGDLFIALSGRYCDGHAFVRQALEKGAGGVIIRDRSCLDGIPTSILKNRLILVVADPYRALINLARSWRHRLTIPLVGITGSVGKTSTKELLRSILVTADISAYVSFKNQNTIIGFEFKYFTCAPYSPCCDI